LQRRIAQFAAERQRALTGCDRFIVVAEREKIRVRHP
jgi:hypothetical protein